MSAPDPELAMAWLAARMIRDREVVFVGIGTPGLAAMIARRLHAPGITMIFESGVIGADPAVLPLSTGSPSVAAGAAMIGDMLDAFATLQQGRIDLGVLSGAQVDRAGNLNSTVLGPYGAPKLRLPGSGGAHDIALLARRTLIVMPHDPKRFVPAVDFVTSPGGRAQAVVTPRAMFDFEGGELRLSGFMPGETPQSVLAGFAWPVPVAADPERLPPPSPAAAAAFATFRSTTGAAA